MCDVAFHDAVWIQKQQVGAMCALCSAIHASRESGVVVSRYQIHPWKCSNEIRRLNRITFMVDDTDFEIVGEIRMNRQETLMQFCVAAIVHDQDRNQRGPASDQLVRTVTITV